jgi:hypothetical protein
MLMSIAGRPTRSRFERADAFSPRGAMPWVLGTRVPGWNHARVAPHGAEWPRAAGRAPRFGSGRPAGGTPHAFLGWIGGPPGAVAAGPCDGPS